MRQRLSGAIHRKICYAYCMRGRPKIGESRKMVTMPAELAQAVDDFRFQNRITTEADAIRRLIEAGVKAMSSSRGSSGGSGLGKASTGKPASRPRKRPGGED
jgi:hypothetical protein